MCFLTYAAFGLCSGVNSFNPTLSFGKGCVIFAALTLVLASVSLLGAVGVARYLYWGIFSTVCLGLIIGVFFPSTFPLISTNQSDQENWRIRLGLFQTHPLAVADICCAAFLICPLRQGKRTWISQAILLCCAVATVSRASTITLLIILVARFATSRSDLWKTASLVCGTGIAIVSLLLAEYNGIRIVAAVPSGVASDYQENSNETDSLNGRIPLWEYTITIMNEHAPLGFGFDGARAELARFAPWAGHSHNTYLETWLIAGPIGWCAFMIGWAITVAKNIRERSGRMFLPIHAYLACTAFVGPVTTGVSGPGLILLALAALSSGTSAAGGSASRFLLTAAESS
jgi:hypothetical protein